MPHELSPNEQEAANRAEVTALLIRSGYRVYRPEADVHGEDLVLRAPPSDDLRQGDLRAVQLKGRPTVARKYARPPLVSSAPRQVLCVGGGVSPRNARWARRLPLPVHHP
jgi:hypothetical protein